MEARTQPALPLNELNDLKEIMFGLFLKYRDSHFQFEPLWGKCVDALGHACRKLRSLPAYEHSSYSTFSLLYSHLSCMLNFNYTYIVTSKFETLNVRSVSV